MRIFVTGALSFIGRELVRHSLDQGIAFRFETLEEAGGHHSDVQLLGIDLFAQQAQLGAVELERDRGVEDLLHGLGAEPDAEVIRRYRAD